MNFSVAVARGMNGVAEDVIFSLEGFVIEFHPASLLIDGLDLGGIWIAHDISNLNYYGLNKE